MSVEKINTSQNFYLTDRLMDLELLTENRIPQPPPKLWNIGARASMSYSKVPNTRRGSNKRKGPKIAKNLIRGGVRISGGVRIFRYI